MYSYISPSNPVKNYTRETFNGAGSRTSCFSKCFIVYLLQYRDTIQALARGFPVVSRGTPMKGVSLDVVGKSIIANHLQCGEALTKEALLMFAPSIYLPITIGFFGLGTGYFIWGGQALLGYPKSSPEVNRTMGMWAFWMPGFMQFVTGIVLLIGMTWFNVFGKTAPLYMAAVAFTAYGIHWFAMAHRRYIDASAAPDAWMAIAFFILSVLGVVIFIGANDIAVALVFVGLSLIYLTEAPTRFGVFPDFSFLTGARLVAVWQVLTGLWLMYMTWAVALNISLNMHLPI